MSTRSIILIKSHDSVARLYRHCDGYPTAQLPVIAQALVDSKGETRGLRFADILIEAGASQGARIVPEDFFAGSNLDLTSEMVGNQGDLEWIYLVDLVTHNVSVYRGSWNGYNFDTISRDKTSDPKGYADQLREEYQVEERTAIVNGVLAIGATGYTVNRPMVPSMQEQAEYQAARVRRAQWLEVKATWDAVVTLLTYKQYAKLPGCLEYREMFLAASKVTKSERIHGLIVEGLAKIDAIESSKPSLSIVKGA